MVRRCTSNGLGQNSAHFTWPALQPTAHPASTPASPSPPRPPSAPAGALDGRRAQAGAGRLPCPRPPPTGQFGCVQRSGLGVSNPHPANWPVWVCSKRPAGRPPAPPRPQGRPTGVRGPVRARRGQNIPLVREGGESLQVRPHPPGYISLLPRDHPPPGPRLGPSRPRRATARGLRGRGPPPGLTVNGSA